MEKTVPIRDKADIHRLLKRLGEWNPNYYIAAVIGIQWGLRCSDILALKAGDVIAGEGSRVQIAGRIMIREIKTGHERHILITDEMRDILREHIKGFGYPVRMDLPLVPSRNRRDGKAAPLSRYRLWRVISSAAGSLCIKGPIGTHSLRKTFAFQAWQDGVSIDVIQKEFGHASVATTHRYACIPDERQDGLYRTVKFAIPTARKHPKKR
jgi:integrase